MEAGFSQRDAPVLLFLEGGYDRTFFLADEFKKLAPHWEIVRIHDRLSAMCLLADADVPQALVIDLTLLNGDGMELIKWVKDQPRFRSLPVVVLSHSDDPSVRHDCIALGVTSYLDKPRSLRELRNNIHYVVKICERSRFHSHEWEEMFCV